MSSRIKSSMRNSAVAIFGQVLNILLNFIIRTIFIKTLGNEYLGINGLFSNILSLLAFAELGFGTAITYALYRPLAEENSKSISALVNFYRRIYRIIGIFILISGISLIPFLDLIIGDTSQIPKDLPRLEYIYILYLVNTASSYFFTYKRSIIIASQNGYIDSFNQLLFGIFKNIGQAIILLVFQSFVGYLIVQIFFTIVGNIAISRKADILFPYLRQYRTEKLAHETTRGIYKNVLAMACHKMGSVIVSGTDNLLITRFCGFFTTGVYSNYLLLTSTIRNVYQQLLTPITASLGNLIATKSNNECYEFFKKFLFLNAYIAVFCTVCLGSLSNPFIRVVWGEDSLFSFHVVILIVMNFYITCMRKASEMFIDTVGLFWQIKWKSIIEAIINLITSIYYASVLNMGLSGVILGTITSNILTNLWWEPYAVYRYYFRRPLRLYFNEYIKYFAMLLLTGTVVYVVELPLSYSISHFILRCLVSFIVPNVLFYAIFGRTIEYRYFLKIVAGFVLEKIGRKAGDG